MKQSKTVYVGNRDAINFVLKHHGISQLPKHNLFAFAENVDKEMEVFAVVSEAGKCRPVVNSVSAKKLGIGEYHLEALQEKARDEARQCGIRPPFAVTVATRIGVVTYEQAAKTQKTVA